VITTARCESEKEYIKGFLNDLGIIVKDVITDLNHSPRIIINDFVIFPSLYSFTANFLSTLLGSFRSARRARL